MAAEPKTLQQAVLYFADPKNCRNYLVVRRWPEGVECPKRGSKNVLFLEKHSRWHCRQKHEAPQFTLKTGTIMEDSPIGLDKWLAAMWMVVNCKNGVSSYEIHRAIGVTQKTAWFLNHRIRLTLGLGPKERRLSGEVEVDETYIGGKARNMHASRRRKLNVRAGRSAANSGVDGQIHTNGMENYFRSLLKRAIGGTYVSVEPFHLFRYLDEQCFRSKNRKMTDGERFSLAVGGIVARRQSQVSDAGRDGAAVRLARLRVKRSSSCFLVNPKVRPTLKTTSSRRSFFLGMTIGRCSPGFTIT